MTITTDAALRDRWILAAAAAFLRGGAASSITGANPAVDGGESLL